MDIVVMAANHSSPEDSNNSHQNLPPPRLKPLLGHPLLLGGAQQTLTILKFIHPEDCLGLLQNSTESRLAIQLMLLQHLNSAEAEDVFVLTYNPSNNIG